jgi:hypothetical protein
VDLLNSGLLDQSSSSNNRVGSNQEEEQQRRCQGSNGLAGCLLSLLLLLQWQLELCSS